MRLLQAIPYAFMSVLSLVLVPEHVFLLVLKVTLNEIPRIIAGPDMIRLFFDQSIIHQWIKCTCRQPLLKKLCKNQLPLQLLQNIHPMHLGLPHPRGPIFLRMGILSRPQDTKHLLRTLDIPNPKINLQLAQRPNHKIPIRKDIALAARDEKRERESRVFTVVVQRERFDARETAGDGDGFGG